MRLTEVELRRVRLPLVTPFRTSRYTEDWKHALLVRLRTEEGVVGWGECVAMEVDVYSPETIDDAVKMLRGTLIPMVLEMESVTAEGAKEAFTRAEGHPMAKAALEMALLDAQLRLDHRSLAEYLGAKRTRVEAGVSVGIMPEKDLIDTVRRYLVEERYRRIKLKIEPGWDVEPVRLVRDTFGSRVPLQVDGNGAYKLDDAQHLAELDRYDLLMIEQPLAADDLDGHAKLARELTTPICLDEPITCTADAIEAIDRGAAAIINIKPGRVGGYLEAREIHRVCAERDVPVWVGGMVETGLGRWANVALAALPHFTLVGDLSASERFFTRDITPPVVVDRDGYIQVPDKPGIGVEPDPAALDEATEDVDQIDVPARVLATGHSR
ncbi:o-succinylbenzoate synthase [Actinoplanes sp. HUAS TT8]|uniref:o-succinylbenzoate synthase n=1 Tax=Actinoplanes sp. HUAS TT8 TaxID=3447453 RepID=UPI003F524036